MPALVHITIKGFKSIASIEQLELRPINVLIGANGSGKSNFLEIFQLLQALGEGRLPQYVGVAGGADKILHFGTKTTPAIAIQLSYSDDLPHYEVRLLPSADDGLFISDETVHDSTGSWHKAQRQAGVDSAELHAMVAWKRKHFSNWRLYHLHDTSPLRKTNSVDDNRYLRPDGSNLAAVLYYLRERHRDTYSLIRSTVQSAAPFFADFVLDPLKLNPDTIRLEWKHGISDQHFGASSLSDGTLRFMALATLFLQPEPERPSIFLVDEPELGLHPYAVGLLAALIRQASVDSQVIVSTQSSLLLDHFQPEEVLVADRVDGATRFSHLAPEELAGWLKEYSLGELWEKNELGERPVRT